MTGRAGSSKTIQVIEFMSVCWQQACCADETGFVPAAIRQPQWYNQSMQVVHRTITGLRIALPVVGLAGK
jgi:hypothetical protein